MGDKDRRLGHQIDRFLLQAGPGGEGGPVERAGCDRGQLVAHPGHPVPERRGGPDRRRRRVVELVGKTGGQGTQREEPFPLPDRLLGVLDAEEQALEQVHGHGEPARASAR